MNASYIGKLMIGLMIMLPNTFIFGDKLDLDVGGILALNLVLGVIIFTAFALMENKNG